MNRIKQIQLLIVITYVFLKLICKSPVVLEINDICRQKMFTMLTVFYYKANRDLLQYILPSQWNGKHSNKLIK